MVSAHEQHVRRTLTLTLSHMITAYSVSGNVIRVRILICATRQKPCRKRVYVDDNNEELALTADSECISRGVPVYSPAFAGLLIAPTHGGMARLSWPGWLVKYQDGAGVIGARERHSSQHQSGLNETNGNQ